MNLDKFEKIINEAFDIKEKINSNSDKSIIEAIKETIELTDHGKIRVAEKAPLPPRALWPCLGPSGAWREEGTSAASALQGEKGFGPEGPSSRFEGGGQFGCFGPAR